MSGDIFKSPAESLTRLGDKATALDDQMGLAGLNATEHSKIGDNFGNWYSGPGGESATKIGLAALASMAGGSLLGGMWGGGTGAGGGEVSASGMDFGGQGVGWNGELSNSGMDFGGQGVGYTNTNFGGVNNQIGQGVGGGGAGAGTNWFQQAQRAQGMMGNQQGEGEKPNPLLAALLMGQNQPNQQQQYAPIYPGVLTRYMG